LTILFLTAAFFIAVAFHEANHAFVATALGDDTPRRAGRLTLNPMRHVDRFGLLMFVLAGFGWGYTPVTPSNLRPNPRLGYAIVAAAGPLANLVIAFALSLPLRMGLPMNPLLHQFLLVAISLNLLLFVLNLLPIPPLDGFSVLLGLVGRPLAERLRQLEQMGPGILIAMIVLSSFVGIDVLGFIYRPVAVLFGLPGLR
ncbi:MAG TPA: site-2 protease family protein, partial [Chloroflexota bacterium]